MKRVVIILILTFTSLTLSASEIGGSDWFYFTENIAISREGNDTYGIDLAIAGGGNSVLFAIIMRGDDPTICTESDDFIMYFEHQAVRMTRDCHTNGDIYVSPKTKTGNEFIINKFISLNYVQIGEGIRNAKGFTTQYNRIKRNLKAL
jgi:hypothetical protein